MKKVFVRTITGIIYLSILALAFFLPLPIRNYVLLSVFTVFLCIALFEYCNLIQKFSAPQNSIQYAIRRWILPIVWIVFPVLLLEYWCVFFNATIILVALIAILCTNDTLAYIFGTLFGKHKIWTKVSPKKSWEGFLGGLISTMAICWLITYIAYFQNDIFNTSYLWAGFAFVIIIAGTFGDFAESMLKRLAQQKDSGVILPGHGGILDRIDSLLFAVPAGFIYWMIVRLFKF